MIFMGSIRDHIRLAEALSEWSGEWVHFTDHPMLTVRPKPYHRDPVGIYFFPKDFTPIAFWKAKPYRFEARIKPGARILDVASMTQADLDHLIDMTGVRVLYDEYHARYPKENVGKRFDMAWEMMSQHFMMQRGAWNKALRATGYDAIFDDTGGIHTAEKQLLVLDPRVIEITGLVRQKISGFASVTKVMDDLAEVCRPFGSVEMSAPRRTRRWGEIRIMGSLTVERSETNYARFEISHMPNDRRPTVNVHLSSSRPSLSYGVGATYEIAAGEYQFDAMTRLTDDLKRIFKQD